MRLSFIDFIWLIALRSRIDHPMYDVCCGVDKSKFQIAIAWKSLDYRHFARLYCLDLPSLNSNCIECTNRNHISNIATMLTSAMCSPQKLKMLSGALHVKHLNPLRCVRDYTRIAVKKIDKVRFIHLTERYNINILQFTILKNQMVLNFH